MPEPPPALKRELGLFSATMVVVGVVIGSGIFIVSGDIARQMGSYGGLMLVWLVAAVFTLLGAYSFTHFARAYPEAGGQYVFLRHAWGDLPAFLYGWATFFVIQTGTLAAVVVAFSKFLGVLVPWVSPDNIIVHFAGHLGLSSQQIVCCAVLIGLTIYNCLGLKEGALLQNVFTVLKVLGVITLIVVGLGLAPMHLSQRLALMHPTNWAFHPQGTSRIWLAAFAAASIGALFSADSWVNVTFLGSEIKNARQIIPKSLMLGMVLVIVLYLLTNLAYINVLSLPALQHTPNDRIATAAMSAVLGLPGAQFMAFAILVSTFGCLNGFVLSGARVFYAMAEDNLFFKSFRQISPRFHTPTVSLLGQCLVAVVLALSGSYGQLLDYSMYTTLLFYVVTIIGLFLLARRDGPLMHLTRWYHYVAPSLYLLLLIFFSITLLYYQPAFTLPGVYIVLAGIPIYFVWKRFYPSIG